MVIVLKDGAKILSNLALITQIGFTIVIILVGCIFLGKYLDQKFGTGVIFLIIFTVLGVLSSFNYIFKIGTQGIGGRKKGTTVPYDKTEIKKISKEKSQDYDELDDEDVDQWH